MTKNSAPKSGFTLIELLIAVSILILLFMITIVSWRNHLNKANDAKRKDDLQRISIAFEEYFSDNNCYPPADILQTCGGDQLQPYLDSVPCDPVYNTPYCYVTDEDSLICFLNYRVLAPLKNISDPIISKHDCHGEEFCGYEDICAIPAQDISGYNYGVSSLNIPLLNPDVEPPTASPDPSTSPSTPPSGQYACDPNGICNSYGDTSTCGISFDDEEFCNTYCPTSDPSERCAY